MLPVGLCTFDASLSNWIVAFPVLSCPATIRRIPSILSTAAATKGLSGVIVDGPARDADESRDVDFPVFARAATPFTARGRVAEHNWNKKIDIGGVAVDPGDLVLADGSGVVFIPQKHSDEVLDKAEEIQGKEVAMAAAVKAGKPVSDVMGGDYETMLVSN
jgi:4-hydroxy-4-methyl-2-oxoglutarate aldolase